MAKFTPEPVQVRIKGIRVVKFLDAKFVGLLEKELPGVKFSHISMEALLDEEGKKSDFITLGHFAKEHEANGIFTVDCDQPETLQKLIRVLEKYSEGPHG